MNFFARLAAEVLAIAPQILQDIWADKANMPHESKIAAATDATMQASTVAQELDPNDAGKIAEATAVTSSLLTALQTPPPAQSQPAAAGAQ